MFAWIALLTGCAPTLQLTVLEPAQVALPASVRRVAVLDRSRPGNVGEGVLGTVEGLFTGEAIGADRAAGRAATEEVINVLISSPRFDAVVAADSAGEVDSSVFAKTLDWSVGRRLAEAAGADALVSLEVLDSDSYLNEEIQRVETEDENGNPRAERLYVFTRNTEIKTVWRVYDPFQNQILDQAVDFVWADSWSSQGEDRSEALSRLPAQGNSVEMVARALGDAYGRRIAPHYLSVLRSWFPGGSDAMKRAADLARADAWLDAGGIWRSIYSGDPDPKLRARAAYNLALTAEMNGQLDAAQRLLVDAVGLHPQAKIRNYLAVIQDRIRKNQEVQRQMMGHGNY